MVSINVVIMVFNGLKEKLRTSVARTSFQFQYLDLMLEINGNLCPLFPVRGESTPHVSVLLILSKTPFSIKEGIS